MKRMRILIDMEDDASIGEILNLGDGQAKEMFAKGWARFARPDELGKTNPKKIMELYVNRKEKCLVETASGWRWEDRPITEELIEEHLRGDITIGVPELTKDGLTRFITVDIDGVNHNKRSAETALDRLHDIVQSAKKSDAFKNAIRFIYTGNTYHMTFYVDNPVPPRLLKEVFIYPLLRLAGFGIDGYHWVYAKGQNKGKILGEILPRKNTIDADETGFAVRLPLGCYVREGNQQGNWSRILFDQTLDDVIPLRIGTELLKAFNVADIEREKREHTAKPDWIQPSSKVPLPACVETLIHRKSVHDGTHQNNLDLVHALIVCGYTEDEIYSVFSGMAGYDYAVTKFQRAYTVKRIRKGVLPANCYQCKTYCNDLHGLECVDSDCPHAPVRFEKSISPTGRDTTHPPENIRENIPEISSTAKNRSASPAHDGQYIVLGGEGVSPPTGDIYFDEMNLDEVSTILEKTIVEDEVNKRIIFCAGILNFTEDDQMNIGLSSGSSTGKTYICLEIAKLFPQENVHDLSYASPKAFYHAMGQLVIDDGKTTPLLSLNEYVRKAIDRWEKLNPKPEKGINPWKAERSRERSILTTEWNRIPKVWCIDLHQKMIIFLDQPDDALLQRLRPLLSHDKKQLRYEITDKSSGGQLRTKNVIIIGYPSVWFLTTRFSPDEQERTRLLLLSPEITQPKLVKSIDMLGLRLSDRGRFDQEIEKDPARIQLKKRIEAIKKADIKQILIDEKQMASLIDTFKAKHGDGEKSVLAPRHQRDFPRLIAIIKANALLNLFNRKRNSDDIWVNQSDIDAGQELYDKIAVSNELGLPPIMYEVYTEIIEPYFYRNEGIRKEELTRQYYQRYKERLGGKRLDEMLDFLYDVGLTQKIPDTLDRRRWMLWPQDKELPLPASEGAEAIAAKDTAKKKKLHDPDTPPLPEPEDDPEPEIDFTLKKLKTLFLEAGGLDRGVKHTAQNADLLAKGFDAGYCWENQQVGMWWLKPKALNEITEAKKKTDSQKREEKKPKTKTSDIIPDLILALLGRRSWTEKELKERFREGGSDLEGWEEAFAKAISDPRVKHKDGYYGFRLKKKGGAA